MALTVGGRLHGSFYRPLEEIEAMTPAELVSEYRRLAGIAKEAEAEMQMIASYIAEGAGS
jgi:hypothetical protein